MKFVYMLLWWNPDGEVWELQEETFQSFRKARRRLRKLTKNTIGLYTITTRIQTR